MFRVFSDLYSELDGDKYRRRSWDIVAKIFKQMARPHNLTAHFGEGRVLRLGTRQRNVRLKTATQLSSDPSNAYREATSGETIFRITTTEVRIGVGSEKVR